MMLLVAAAMARKEHAQDASEPPHVNTQLDHHAGDLWIEDRISRGPLNRGQN